MKRLPEEFVEELRKHIDIVDVVSEYVQLRRAGRSHVGLCPFHSERSPSFSVSPERQMFHCFGCGAGGTVIRFVMDIEGVSFMEAVVQLANRANLPLPDTFDLQNVIQPETTIHQQIIEVNELAAKLYNYILMNTAAGAQALSYLEKRGLSRQTIMDFRMGYAPEGRQTVVNFLERRGFQKDLLLETGLVVEYGSQMIDRFRDRVMIPILNLRNHVVAFGGRSISSATTPKYLNSPETRVFHKGMILFHHQYARKSIRKSRTALLFEGYMDVVAAVQAGVENGVASLGTSLTIEQASLLKRDCEQVVIVYDADRAGISAAERALDICEQVGLQVKIVQLPEGQDPDEYIRMNGAQAFQRSLSVSALSPVQFLVKLARAKADLLSPVGRTNFIRQSLEILAQKATPIEEEVELRNLSTEFNVSVDTLKEEQRLVAKTPSKIIKPRSVNLSDMEKPSKIKGFIEAGNRILQLMMGDSRTCEFLLERNVNELVLPEQTALLAMLYAWQLDTKGLGLASFVDSIEDSELRKLASSLLVDETTPEFDPNIVEDYLRTIQLHLLEIEHRHTLGALVQAQLRGDASYTEQMKLRVDALQRQIAALKLPREMGSHRG